MTLREYCQRLGISRRTAYRQLASGKLAGRKLPGGGWRISEGECARLSGEEQESLSAQITARILEKSGQDLELYRKSGYIEGVMVNGEWRYSPEAIAAYIRYYC